MVQVHDVVEGNSRAGRGDRALGGRKHAGRLILAVAHDERVFFLGTDAAGKLGGDIAFEIEHAVVDELLGNLDGGAQLVRADGNLTEGVIALRIQTALVHPCCLAVTGDDGNLALAAGGLDDRGEGAEKVLVLQRLNERLFKLVRDKVAALGIRANSKGVGHVVVVLFADAVPERLLVGIGSASGFLLARVIARQVGERRRSRLCKLRVNGGLLFQTFDLLAEVHHIGFHFVIGCGILGGDQAVRAALGIEKRFRRFPRLRSLFSEFKNLIHK